MIFGIGCDIINTERLKKDPDFMEHFMRRSFSQDEKEAFGKREFSDDNKKLLYLAKRFAAKEAVSKAFGTGFRRGLYLSDIEIFNDKEGKPFVTLSEKAENILKELSGKTSYKIHLSLSDDIPFAQAMALIEIDQ